jgi:glycosyl transferase family 2
MVATEENQLGVKFDLSIVIAAWPDVRGLSSCLESILAQRDAAVEVLVASSQSFDPELVLRFAEVNWLQGGPERLIPQLWSLGIASARGGIVATTTAHCVPKHDWIARMREAHVRLDAAGIGGPIEAPRGGSAVEWATYFLRYSNYFNYHCEQNVHEIAADNASYKREGLEAHRDAMSGGFWEPDFHRLLFAEGKALAFVPEIRVRLATSFGFGWFCAQRLHHGRQFGAARVREAGAALRMIRIVSSPLIPAVLLAKVFARVLRSRRDLAPFFLSLPVLLAFILAWTAGEVWGYLSATSGGELPAARRTVST